MKSTQEEINKFLTEEFLGECWHEDLKRGAYDYAYCPKCKSDVPENGTPFNTDLFTSEGFFKLWNQAQTKEWWNDFWSSESRMRYIGFLHEDYINPEKFANTLYKYLKGLKQLEEEIVDEDIGEDGAIPKGSYPEGL